MLPSRGWDTTIILLVIILQLLSAISAQSTSTQSSSSSQTSSSSSSRATASSGPKVHVVEVGSSNDFAYHPNVTRAAVGDIVSFQFWPNNHSVVRGVYTDSDDCGTSGCNPCIPYELIHPKEKGKSFKSGNILTDVTWSTGNDSTVFNYTVVDESPVWFFCDATSSCAGRGMVGVINPAGSQSMDKQVTTATKTKIELSPGQEWPYKDVPAGALNTTVPSAPKATETAKPQHLHGLSGGAIAGITVGAVVVLLLAAALCYFVGRSNTYREVIKHHHRSDGVPSQAGDVHSNSAHMQGSQHASPPMAHAWQDHRISGQTAWSTMSPPDAESGTFVGYNRQTGAPEFAAEAEAPIQPMDQKLSPPPGHPAFGHQTQQATTYELPAEAPPGSGPPSHSSPNPNVSPNLRSSPNPHSSPNPSNLT